MIQWFLENGNRFTEMIEEYPNIGCKRRVLDNPELADSIATFLREIHPIAAGECRCDDVGFMGPCSACVASEMAKYLPLLVSTSLASAISARL